jgi:hypothetical protein
MPAIPTYDQSLPEVPLVRDEHLSGETVTLETD